MQKNHILGTNIKRKSPVFVWSESRGLMPFSWIDFKCPPFPLWTASLPAHTTLIHQSNTDKWQLPQELLHNKSFVFDCQRQTVQLQENVFFCLFFLYIKVYSFTAFHIHSCISITWGFLLWNVQIPLNEFFVHYKALLNSTVNDAV